MEVVNVHEAKTHFSRLIERVLGGEEVVIAKAGRPVAKLVPVGREQAARQPGSARGEVKIADDFDAPLPDDIQAGFE
jgi:prevent-host-death family protein